eukprot:4545774-Amphidinium_carterae.1
MGVRWGVWSASEACPCGRMRTRTLTAHPQQRFQSVGWGQKRSRMGLPASQRKRVLPLSPDCKDGQIDANLIVFERDTNGIGTSI